MAKGHTYRNMYYKFAGFSEPGFNGNLEVLLRSSLQSLDAAQLRCPSGFMTDQHFDLNDHKLIGDDQGLCIQICAHSENNKASTIDRQIKTKNRPMSEAEPPSKKNFVVADVLAYVRGNHVIISGDHTKDRIFHETIETILKRANAIVPEMHVSSSYQGATDKLKEIASAKIKTIKVNVTQALGAIENCIVQGTSGLERNALAALHLLKGDTEGKRRPADSQVWVEITGGRMKKGQDFTNSWVFDRAKEIATDFEDNYRIVLNNGKVISPDELKICKPTKLPKFGATVNVEKAWMALQAYYNELEKTKQLAGQ